MKSKIKNEKRDRLKEISLRVRNLKIELAALEYEAICVAFDKPAKRVVATEDLFKFKAAANETKHRSKPTLKASPKPKPKPKPKQAPAKQPTLTTLVMMHTKELLLRDEDVGVEMILSHADFKSHKSASIRSIFNKIATFAVKEGAIYRIGHRPLLIRARNRTKVKRLKL